MPQLWIKLIKIAKEMTQTARGNAIVIISGKENTCLAHYHLWMLGSNYKHKHEPKCYKENCLNQLKRTFR